MSYAMFTSNGLEVVPGHLGLLNVVTAPSELREQYERDGYVLLRGALNRTKVLDIGALYFGMHASAAKSCEAQEVAMPAHGVPGHPAHAFVRTKAFQTFCEAPEIRKLASELIGEPIVRLRRTPVRYFEPGHIASRAHADLDYLSEGSEEIVTAWVPLGDCPATSGGLVYLEGSHKADLSEMRRLMAGNTDRPNDQRPITNDLTALARATGMKWLYADYKAGDVVLHNPRIVHASLDCGGLPVRLSTDIRYARSDKKLDPRWNEDWAGNDGK